MKFHELAAPFPMLPDKELEAMAEDIRLNGQHFPIVRWQGKILDGRNRWVACERAGVKPVVKEYRGKDGLGLVVSLNLKRRHMGESQRAMAAAKLANMKVGRNWNNSPNSDDKISLEQAAGLFYVSRSQVADAKLVLKEGGKEAIAAVEAGESTVSKEKKRVKQKGADKALKLAASMFNPEKLAGVCDVRVCSFEKLLAEVKPDAIITDPPYPKEFLPLYGRLAELSRGVPLVAVMCGQSYFPEVLAAMVVHLKYRWTLAYLTPGGQSAQQFDRKVNTFWKPVLLFGEAAEWLGDVARSEVNDNDKDHHQWGQSESGMADLVGRLTKPGQLVCDPFVGGGTTAVVSMVLKRRFVGCDLEKKAVEETLLRVRASA